MRKGMMRTFTGIMVVAVFLAGAIGLSNGILGHKPAGDAHTLGPKGRFAIADEAGRKRFVEHLKAAYEEYTPVVTAMKAQEEGQKPLAEALAEAAKSLAGSRFLEPVVIPVGEVEVTFEGKKQTAPGYLLFSKIGKQREPVVLTTREGVLPLPAAFVPTEVVASIADQSKDLQDTAINAIAAAAPAVLPNPGLVRILSLKADAKPVDVKIALTKVLDQMLTEDTRETPSTPTRQTASIEYALAIAEIQTTAEAAAAKKVKEAVEMLETAIQRLQRTIDGGIAEDGVKFEGFEQIAKEAKPESEKQIAAQKNLQRSRDLVSALRGIQLARTIQEQNEFAWEGMVAKSREAEEVSKLQKLIEMRKTQYPLLIDTDTGLGTLVELLGKEGLEAIQKKVGSTIILCKVREDNIAALLTKNGFEGLELQQAFAISTKENQGFFEQQEIRLIAMDKGIISDEGIQFVSLDSLAKLSSLLRYLPEAEGTTGYDKLLIRAVGMYRLMVKSPEVALSMIRDYLDTGVLPFELPDATTVYQPGELEEIKELIGIVREWA